MAKEKFFTRPFFEKSSKIQISYLEAAIKSGTTRRTAINRFKRDIENGYIERKRTTYKCPKYKRRLDGKNIYFLTGKGRGVLGLPPYGKKEKKRQKDRELLTTLKGWMLSDHHKRKNIFQKVLPLCPDWWADDPKLLQKTLLLLRRKLIKGYRIRSPLRWISSVLKERGVGFRRKKAREYSEVCTKMALSNSFSDDSVVSFSSPYIAEAFGNLGTLAKKGLDVSEESMVFLLRKGFDQLALAAKVLCRIEKKREIQNPNGFLSWLVGLQDPFSIFEGNKKNIRFNAF